MSMCRVISCVVGRGCLLWQVHSLGKTLLAFALFILYSKAKFACYSRYLLTSYFCILVPYNEKDIFFFLVLFLKGLVGHHRTIQLQLLRHYIWLEHTLGLLWYWMVCLGNEQKSFCHFWGCTQVLHFRLFGWLWGLLHFFWEILAHSSRYNGRLNSVSPFWSILVHWFLKCRCSLLPSSV